MDIKELELTEEELSAHWHKWADENRTYPTAMDMLKAVSQDARNRVINHPRHCWKAENQTPCSLNGTLKEEWLLAYGESGYLDGYKRGVENMLKAGFVKVEGVKEFHMTQPEIVEECQK